MLLEISRSAYEEIAELMRLHRGEAAFVEQDGQEMILMDGTALRVERPPIVLLGRTYGKALRSRRRWPTRRERRLAGGD